MLASTLTLAQTAATQAAATQADRNPTVYINGMPIKGTAVTVGGKQFVQLPLSDLQKSGALVSGGSAPVKAIQGCLGQPLFNGVVRITLTSAGVKDGKYLISFRVANGTQKTINPATDANAAYDAMYAASDDGQVAQFTVPDGYTSESTGNVQVTPGANVLEQAVLNTVPSFTVTRILYRPDAGKLKDGRANGLPFAPLSNMEFALSCK
ncbi:hypothetical protein [Deinococcus sp.]|uniref:hypothetical protein n=1 Tax=Deinococcus sp. TaxID=47478 RepID=UPI003C7A0682